MIELSTEDQIENEYTIAVLEAGSRWSPRTQAVRAFAQNTVVLSQVSEESAFAFAARVEKRTRQLTEEFGRVLRAGIVGVAPARGAEASAARFLIVRALARAAADGCVVVLSLDSNATHDDRREVRALARGRKMSLARRGTRLVVAQPETSLGPCLATGVRGGTQGAVAEYRAPVLGRIEFRGRAGPLRQITNG